MYSSIMQNTLKLINDQEFASRKGRPNNSEILQNWFPQKLDPHSLSCRNLKTLGKVLLNHAECIEI